MWIADVLISLIFIIPILVVIVIIVMIVVSGRQLRAEKGDKKPSPIKDAFAIGGLLLIVIQKAVPYLDEEVAKFIPRFLGEVGIVFCLLGLKSKYRIASLIGLFVSITFYLLFVIAMFIFIFWPIIFPLN